MLAEETTQTSVEKPWQHAASGGVEFLKYGVTGLGDRWTHGFVAAGERWKLPHRSPSPSNWTTWADGLPEAEKRKLATGLICQTVAVLAALLASVCCPSGLAGVLVATLIVYPASWVVGYSFDLVDMAEHILVVALVAVPELGIAAQGEAANTANHFWGPYLAIMLALNILWTVTLDIDDGLPGKLRIVAAALLCGLLGLRTLLLQARGEPVASVIATKPSSVVLFMPVSILWLMAYAMWNVLFVFAHYPFIANVHNVCMCLGVWYYQNLIRDSNPTWSGQAIHTWALARGLTLGAGISIHRWLELALGEPAVPYITCNMWTGIVSVVVVVLLVVDFIALISHAITVHQDDRFIAYGAPHNRVMLVSHPYL